jgi:hypothetical protein
MQIDIWWTVLSVIAGALMALVCGATVSNDLVCLFTMIGTILFLHSTDALCLDRPKNLMALLIGGGLFYLVACGVLAGRGGGTGTEDFQQGGDW